MKKLSVILVVFSLLFSVSCKEETKEITPSQMKQVMAAHDEVMPKMGTIGKLVAELNPMADSTEAGAPYLKAKHDLQKSHTAMMDWMKGFGDRFDSDEIMKGKALSPEKQEWLNEEQEKVEDLKTLINTSIANAEQLLNKKQN